MGHRLNQVILNEVVKAQRTDIDDFHRAIPIHMSADILSRIELRVKLRSTNMLTSFGFHRLVSPSFEIAYS